MIALQSRHGLGYGKSLFLGFSKRGDSRERRERFQTIRCTHSLRVHLETGGEASSNGLPLAAPPPTTNRFMHMLPALAPRIVRTTDSRLLGPFL
ncbi:MAG: hypothetical protein NTZ94_17385 [Verrucomicrobia bacterium]|nr:hypothetical protein [Verrucomicrobiota bacterium]